MRPRRNLLATETSPYLKLHAQQPVHWIPWNEQAFKWAIEERKPILLSVGYSTCHWCHVMARESFANLQIAQTINESFIAIKLDREEHPEVDALYMTAHQAMNEGGGGWPLNIFLTPEQKPFFSGTYFPPLAKMNRPGFDQILKGVSQAWSEKQEQVLSFSTQLTLELSRELVTDQNTSSLGDYFLSHTQEIILSRSDSSQFGWGRGPKFPNPQLVRFLLHSTQEEPVKFALNTCQKMAQSGLYDHINGGFHRYCVDREWSTPHFEKMLYDQAQLIETYLDAYLISKNPYFETVARETCEFVIRELRSPTGAFYSALDAQSEGKEGKFSCWTLRELQEHFSSSEMALLQKHFNLSEEGNFYDFSDPEALKNQNVLHIQTPLENFSTKEQKHLKQLKETLFKLRAHRPPPATDTKILLSWNALIIAALARASQILEKDTYLTIAEESYLKIYDTHQSGEIFFHSEKDGQRNGEQLGSDLSSLSYASRQLYHATLKPSYLQEALQLADTILSEFYDPVNGGFYETREQTSLIIRLKGEADQALPTVSSQMIRELSALSLFTENKLFQKAIEKTLTYYQGTLQTEPFNLSDMLLGLAQMESKHTLFFTFQEQEETSPYLKSAHQVFPTPLIFTNPSPPKQTNSPHKHNRVTIYNCQDQTCSLPVHNLEDLEHLLSNKKPPPLTKFNGPPLPDSA